jgi:hypothetical protein
MRRTKWVEVFQDSLLSDVAVPPEGGREQQQQIGAEPGHDHAAILADGRGEPL